MTRGGKRGLVPRELPLPRRRGGVRRVCSNGHIRRTTTASCDINDTSAAHRETRHSSPERADLTTEARRVSPEPLFCTVPAE